MKDQHKMIKGYRDLDQGTIDLMNEIKGLGETIETVLKKVNGYLNDQWEKAYFEQNIDEIARLHDALAAEWKRDAEKDFKVALMKLTRSVAQPTSF